MIFFEYNILNEKIGGEVLQSAKEYTEMIEEERLSSFACLSNRSKGRTSKSEPCKYRTEFQRDRDRIIHSNSFRRLKHKTQVFLSPHGDHYRTRLTHTLEVSQIGRTMARALRLNEDLVEAISMGHDLGHTPFGHAGEYALNEICPDGFVHSKQSVRVVEILENNGKGLNLTYEVKNGIACHSTGSVAETLEGRLVKYADKIAYMNHDIEDAVRAGVLSESDIPFEVKCNLGNTKSERITAFIASIIENSSDDIRMDEETNKMYNLLRNFLFENVYQNTEAKGEEGKARDMLKYMYTYFVANPYKLPETYKDIAEKWGVNRAVCDYISGMTDKYVLDIYSQLFIPKSWGM